MVRLTVVSAAAAIALLAACGPKAEAPVPAAKAEPAFADDWYSVSGEAVASGPSSIDIHQTKYGPQGRIWRDDQMYPLRNLKIANGIMLFIVPSLEASYSGKAGAAGSWTGTWETKEGNQSANLSSASAPDLKSKMFVTLKDGRQMFLDCRGEGSPVVVFDAGAGGTTKDWVKVHDEIAKTTRACVYDRAAHGLSDPRPLPLDAAAVADDLDEMLTAAHVPAPYVLVGHSLGSYHVRQFANTRFDKMAGMVLVDPSGDNQEARFNAVIPEAMATMKKLQSGGKDADCVNKLRQKLVMRDDPLFKTCNGTNDWGVFEQTQSEIDSMTGSSLDELTKSKRSYGAMPLIVLTRTDYKKGAPPELAAKDLDGMKKVWVAMHEEMAALSTAGEHRTVPETGHYIQMVQPLAVIQAVNDVVAKARAGASKP